MTEACLLLWSLTGLALAEAPTSAAWKTVDAPRAIELPRDHAAHPDYRIEWWYYTGNLHTPQGRRFGYQLTFFRTGLVFAPENPSHWAVRDLYIAHWAISDIDGGKFHVFQRANRHGLGTAGADTDRYRVWNGPWEARLDGETHVLSAVEGDTRLSLRLRPGKPVVLHGEQGLSRKGPTPGNASYYYSLTRMPTEGSLTLGGQTFPLSGQSWMDHEFSSSFLESGQRGWDWLSIQLDDGRELMIYQIRRDDGSRDRFSSGTLVAADGSTVRLTGEDFTLKPQSRWKSPHSGAEYPIAWTLSIPSQGLELQLSAALASQEMTTTPTAGFPYWEGGITIQGTSRGKSIRGEGYLEMTGYAGLGQFLSR